jgi:hypothetical protein
MSVTVFISSEKLCVPFPIPIFFIRFYGEAVVEACVETGAHHLDISGEPAFLEKVQLKYHQKVGPFIERQIYLLDIESRRIAVPVPATVRSELALENPINVSVHLVFNHFGLLTFVEKVQLKYHQKVGPQLLNSTVRNQLLINP